MAGSFPKEGTFGYWLEKGNSDVHVYVDPKTVVLGTNLDRTNIRFTDIAISFNADGTISVQYAGPEGQKGPPEIKQIDPEKFRALYLNFLNTVKAFVQ